MRFNLDKEDFKAIENLDDAFLLNKGAKAYNSENFYDAIEYYRLAASMGNYQAVANLGYCYMYARSVEQNNLLALAYFKIAANQGIIDALYKLGEIYSMGKIVEKNDRIANEYYKGALEAIMEKNVDPCEYPSLFLALAKECIYGKYKEKDIDKATKYLLIAKKGFGTAIENGQNYWKNSYEYANKLLENLSNN